MSTPPLREWQKRAGQGLKPSPCGCIERLREFKNLTLGKVWREIQVMDVPGLGVFGMDYPDKERVEELLMELKESLDDYTKDCPFEPGPEAAALINALEEATGEKATLKDIIEGTYNEYYRGILEKAEVFTAAALRGILQETTGHRFTRGPFSFNEETAFRCSAMLNNLEASSFEMTALSEKVEAGWPPPIEIVDHEIELNDLQRDMYREYLSMCKPKTQLVDMNNIEMVLESWPIKREWDMEKLGKYDAWTEEKYGAGSLHPNHPDFEHWMKRITDRADPIAEIHDDIINHQGPINVFLEDEWLTACGPLQWKTATVGGADMGMMAQVDK